MNKYNQKNIIIIQRYYRINKLLKLINEIKKYDLLNNKLDFNEYKKIIMNKNLLNLITELINRLNLFIKPKINITNKIILTAFIITNYTNEILGQEIDRHFMDNNLLEASNIIIFMLYNISSYYHFIKFNNILNDYDIIFNNWKKLDKNRTIQNIIISYHNRKKHIEILNDNITKQTLENECNNLLKSIKIIDPTYDINYLINNYENIYQQIFNIMNNLYTSIKNKYETIYCDYLIDEFKNKSNINIIVDLIRDTNNRLLEKIPLNIKTSITCKINSYKLNDILFENNWTQNLINYFNFIIDTIKLLQSNNNFDNIYKLVGKNYYTNIPLLLIEINKIIDLI